ncbi:hypothetical protein AB1046_08375 [Promicromonospora sp. Populi]|uniref:hypothetical protein n=1 Tax=Promicromonospora sp. Populi TaxID=3239420 RepID=UPI0034E2B945
MPHLATARRTAALAAVVGLALATAGCGTGTEQPASASTAVGTPEPRVAASGGPTELPTFDPSSAVATYADGFPADLFPMPEGATLLASSAQAIPATEDGGTPMTQVTLNLSSRLSANEVVDQVEEILVDQGFRQIEAPDASGLAAQTAFLRLSDSEAGEVQESLVIGVLDDGDRRLASISGTVRTP